MDTNDVQPDETNEVRCLCCQKLIDGKTIRRRKLNGSAKTIKTNSKNKATKKSPVKKSPKS